VRKKLAYGLAVLSILLVISGTLKSVGAATYTVGVPTGTAADYSFAQTDVKSTKVHIGVTGVSTPVITYTIAFYNPDNSLNSSHSGVAYNITDIWSYSALQWFIGANLTVNDPLAPGLALFVNETVTGYSTAGSTRTVNHSNWTFRAFNVPVLYYDAWWDKPTGLLVKLTWHSVQSSAYWINITLTATSLWTPGYGGGLQLSTTTLLLIGGGAIVVVAIVVILVRRK
jgi:hypothetical protein